jgi:hypothetical protein
MEEIEHRAPPAGELRYEDDIDFAGLSKREHFLPFDPIALGARGGLLPHTDDLVTGFLGEDPKVPLLTGTGLVGGRYPAIERG